MPTKKMMAVEIRAIRMEFSRGNQSIIQPPLTRLRDEYRDIESISRIIADVLIKVSWRNNIFITRGNRRENLAIRQKRWYTNINISQQML